jgi:hypothetical protein
MKHEWANMDNDVDYACSELGRVSHHVDLWHSARKTQDAE